ncbi:serine hydrolase domain-containing protein [Sinomicrobium sp. M5D2P9]
MLKSTIIPFIFTLLYISCVPGGKETIKNLKNVEVPPDSLNTFIRARMHDWNIPGLSIAVINNSEVVYHQTFGYADLEKQLPITETTIFEGASISKSVFAFFVMQYVEEGKLDLDKPLYEYLPYPDIAYDERYKKITARMVLSHRSGFPNWRENEEDKKLKIKFEPGTDYEYSGEGYQYLAMVLKHIEGTDWNDLEKAFQDKVAKPIGMKHTVFIQTPYTRKHKAEPYDGEGKPIDWKNNYWYKKDDGRFVAPASIHTEPLDFSKWMIAVMNRKVLSGTSYEELFKHHSLTSTSGINVYYTLGFVTADEPYNNTYFHSGNNDGFTCWYLMDVDKKWGYVLFTNSTYGEKLGNALWDYLEKEEY